MVAFVGYANSGKTTLVTQVVKELSARGYRLAVVKHHGHGGEADLPGKDTWRYAQAGAEWVCLAAGRQVAVFHQVRQEPKFEDLLTQFPQADLILVEGYKQEQVCKIEVFRQEAGQNPLGLQENLLAVVADRQLYSGIPHLGLDDIGGVADLLEQRLLQVKKREAL